MGLDCFKISAEYANFDMSDQLLINHMEKIYLELLETSLSRNSARLLSHNSPKSCELVLLKFIDNSQSFIEDSGTDLDSCEQKSAVILILM